MPHVLVQRRHGIHAEPGQRRWGRLLAAPVVALAVAVVPAGAGQATAPAPGLRLLATAHHLDVQRFGNEPGLYIPAAIYAASTNGPFEIDPMRAGDEVLLWQVSRTSSVFERIRRIHPLAPVRFDHGIPEFFRVTLRNTAGHVVAQSKQDFCPTADYGASRVNGDGPDNPAYPYYCGSRLTRRTVWGIDRGWAVPIYSSLDAPASSVPDGSYRLTIRIDPSYAHQLHLDSSKSFASFTVRITTETDNGCPPNIVCAPRGHAALSHRTAAPRTRATTPGRPNVTPGSTGGLPDLAALPARSLTIQHDSDNGRDYLNFAATIWNAGPGTLDVEGFRRGHKPLMTARQFIYQHGVAVSSFRIGKFEFDTRPGHNHWHLEDVARYSLLSRNGDNLVRSGKQSFCLAPTDPINLTLPGALWQPDRVGLYSSCPSDQSIWLRETLPAGWGDTYVQSAAGQAFNITDVANGVYLVRVTTNPFHNIHEATFTNNSSLVKVRLGGAPGARTAESLGAVSN